MNADLEREAISNIVFERVNFTSKKDDNKARTELVRVN